MSTDAQFNGPWGIVHYAPTGLLYLADYGNNATRKIVVATANVTAVATMGASCYYIRVAAKGTFLYVTTEHAVVIVNTTLINSVTTLAGSTTNGHNDGVGAAAQFNYPRGIALNSDESALIIADYDNNRIRRLELSNNNNSVATIAGSSTSGGTDGPGLNATFNLPFGAKWRCNQPSKLCGVLVVDAESSAVRLVAIEGPTATAVMTASISTLSSGTASLSTPSIGTATAEMESSSQSGTASSSVSRNRIAGVA